MASSFLPELSGLPDRRLGALLLPDRLDPRPILLRQIPQEPDVPALELAPLGGRPVWSRGGWPLACDAPKPRNLVVQPVDSLFELPDGPSELRPKSTSNDCFDCFGDIRSSCQRGSPFRQSAQCSRLSQTFWLGKKTSESDQQVILWTDRAKPPSGCR